LLEKKMGDLGVQDVLSAVTELESYYRKRNTGVRKGVELYRRKASLKVPDGVIEVIAHTATTICDRGADRIGGGRFQNHMEPRRSGDTELKHIETLEKASAAILWMGRKRSKSNPVRAWALHGFNRGGMVAKFQLDTDCLSEKPKRSEFDSELAHKKAHKLWLYRQLEKFPVIIDARPIEAIYPDPESDGDNFVIEHYKRSVGDIKKNYPNWEKHFGGLLLAGDIKKGKKKYDDDTTVEYVEVWTREWRAVIVEGAWCPIGEFEAGPIPNLYGRPPYFIRYPFGDPTGAPEERCVNILRAIEDELMMESRMMTVVQTVAESGAYGATVIDSSDEAAKSTISFGPGAVVESDKLGEGKGPRPLVQQNRLGDALQALQVASSAAADGAVPSEARGAPSPGRSGQPSGVAAAILTGQASMVIDPVKGAIEDLVSDMIPFIFYVLDVLWDGKLKLHGQVGANKFVDLDLDSDTIDGHYGPVYVTLKLQAPEENHASWNLGIQAKQAEMPDEFILEKFFAVENAAEMVKDMMVQKIARSEPVLMYLAQRLVERLQAKAADTADAVPGSKVPMPAGAPPMMPPGMPMVPNGGMAGPPMDPMMRATLGVAPGVPGGAPQVTGPML
jgi:hypothetical protein